VVLPLLFSDEVHPKQYDAIDSNCIQPFFKIFPAKAEPKLIGNSESQSRSDETLAEFRPGNDSKILIKKTRP
jgi:hypothetical protein